MSSTTRFGVIMNLDVRDILEGPKLSRRVQAIFDNFKGSLEMKPAEVLSHRQMEPEKALTNNGMSQKAQNAMDRINNILNAHPSSKFQPEPQYQ